jgi:hypothetical protein
MMPTQGSSNQRAFARIPSHRILSIFPTFQCTAACSNCGTLSSPQNKTWLSHADAERAILQACDGGYSLVVFTGGEPTLAGSWLFNAIGLAKSLSLCTRVVTNGWWARRRSRAEAMVKKFVDAGLDELNFSTGDEHARFVPIESVIEGSRAAVSAGLPVAIMVETVKDRAITKTTLENHPCFRNVLREFPSGTIWVEESPWMPLDPTERESYPDGISINRSNLAVQRGCDSVLSTTTVEADGTIGACCGIGMRLVPELQLGHIQTDTLAEADRKAANDFLKRWIRIEGPEKILAWAAEHNPNIEWEDMYAHRCQACLRLYSDPAVRKVIREHHTEKLADVLFGEWLVYQHEGDLDRVVDTDGNHIDIADPTGEHANL